MEEESRETAYAKLNLALHVRGKRQDGYHELETVFAFVDSGDALTVHPQDEISLEIDGQFGDGLSNSDNLVLQAAELLQDVSGVDAGAEIQLTKNLPIASGIGGGSADAAATFRLLNRFWGLDYSISELTELSKPLGADVPACVQSKLTVGKGIGQDLKALESIELSGLRVILVNPLIQISTAEIFSLWDGIDHGPLETDKLLPGRNDLVKPAILLAPVIGEILSALDETRPTSANMSGSGATCFALYETEEHQLNAKSEIKARYPNFWYMTGRLI